MIVIRFLFLFFCQDQGFKSGHRSCTSHQKRRLYLGTLYLIYRGLEAWYFEFYSTQQINSLRVVWFTSRFGYLLPQGPQLHHVIFYETFINIKNELKIIRVRAYKCILGIGVGTIIKFRIDVGRERYRYISSYNNMLYIKGGRDSLKRAIN